MLLWIGCFFGPNAFDSVWPDGPFAGNFSRTASMRMAFHLWAKREIRSMKNVRFSWKNAQSVQCHTEFTCMSPKVNIHRVLVFEAFGANGTVVK